MDKYIKKIIKSKFLLMIFLVANSLNLLAQSVGPNQKSNLVCTETQYRYVLDSIRTTSTPTDRITLKNNLDNLMECVQNKLTELSNTPKNIRVPACSAVANILRDNITTLKNTVDSQNSNFSEETANAMLASLNTQLQANSANQDSVSNVVSCFGVVDNTVEF